MNHSTAIVDASAEIDPSCEIGPWCVVEEGVTLGVGCKLGPFVHIRGRTVIGAENRFHSGSVIGDDPQDLKYDGGTTALVIGDGNVFREHVTVHRSTKRGEQTRIGSKNYFMAGSHIGHNCVVGDHVIMANGAMLGGHVEVQDRAFISGNSMVHQFCRVGTLALMQGGSAISKDLPPFCIGRGHNGICGLNVVGMRRAGLSIEERTELKRLYHAVFRSGVLFQEALEKAGEEFRLAGSKRMLEFLRDAKRGVCADTGGEE